MAFTLAQLEALDAAIVQGVTTVTYGDKSVTYRSLDEMLRLRNQIKSELGINTAPKFVYPSVSKGLNRRCGRG